MGESPFVHTSLLSLLFRPFLAESRVRTAPPVSNGGKTFGRTLRVCVDRSLIFETRKRLGIPEIF